MTVKARLENLFKLIRLEDSHMSCRYGSFDRSVQVIGDMDLPEETKGMAVSNWSQSRP